MQNHRLISQNQLNNTKVYTDRWYWISTLPQGISFIEVGVAGGDFSSHILLTVNPSKLILIDTFEQEDPKIARPGLPPRYGRGENLDFVKNRFKNNASVQIICGDSIKILKDLSKIIPKTIDVIYVDASHSYNNVSSDIENAAKILKEDGTLAINDYISWDENAERYDVIYAVNEFLENNQDWYVSGIALERNMYADIYLKRSSSIK